MFRFHRRRRSEPAPTSSEASAGDLVRLLKQNSSSLTRIDLDGRGLSQEEVANLAEAVRPNTFVTYVSLSSNGIDAAGAANIAATVEKNNTLATLCLRDNRIGDEGAVALAMALCDNETLEVLAIANNGIGDVGISAIAAAMRCNGSLASLQLSRNNIGEGATNMADALLDNHTLTSLSLDDNNIEMDVIRNIQKMVEMNAAGLGHAKGTLSISPYSDIWDKKTTKCKLLGDSSFRKEDFPSAIHLYSKAIKSYLGVNGERKEPNHVLLSNRSAAYLANGDDRKAVADAETCTKIAPYYSKGWTRLAAARITMGHYEEAMSIYRRLGKMFEANAAAKRGLEQAQELWLRSIAANDSHITEIDLHRREIADDDVVSLSDVIGINATVTKVDLGDNYITESGAVVLAESLASNKTILDLRLQLNQIGLKGSSALAGALLENHCLSRLSLADCRIGDGGAVALAEAIKVNGTLSIISLGYNSIGPEGAAAIAAAIKINHSLRSLRLEFNCIGNRGATTIADALKSNQTLIELNLNRNEIRSDGAVAIFSALQDNQALKSLHFAHNKIGEEGGLAIEDTLLQNHTISHLEMDCYNLIGEDLMRKINHLLSINQTGLDDAQQEKATLYYEMLKTRAANALRNMDYPEAIVQFSKAISVNPTDHVLIYDRSIAHLANGDKNQAIIDAEACTAMSPLWVDGHIHLAVAKASIGEYREAIETYQKVLNELDNTNDTARKGIKDIQRIQNIECGRQVMEKAMTSSSEPSSIPPEYLESVTNNFSDDCLIGEGGFGKVYIGEDVLLGRRFAVKSVHTSNDSHVEEMKRTLLRELEALKQFRHPNIAHLYAFHITDDLNGEQCLVYELATQGSLDNFFRSDEGRENLPWRKRITIALDIAEALNFLHQGKAGYACHHRDIKSANICIRQNWTAQLIGFGMSQMVAEDNCEAGTSFVNSAPSTFFGSPGYICPTYARRLTSYTSANDVFSFGIVLVEIFTGKLQLHSTDGVEVDFFDRYSMNGDGIVKLEDEVDTLAGVWDVDANLDFVSLAVSCLALRPSDRPDVRSTMKGLEDMAHRCCTPVCRTQSEMVRRVDGDSLENYQPKSMEEKGNPKDQVRAHVLVAGVENASDDEQDDSSLVRTNWEPSKGQWMEPVEGFDVHY